MRSGTAFRRCVFELFPRQLPPGRRYGVVAGTGRALEALATFHFDPDEVEAEALEEIGQRLGVETLAYAADGLGAIAEIGVE